ncbi:YcxB family protein [Neobacillus terrae]|uniref:YcxB family protein n=1 Tax=Neobacillus terrae TaxID=3034837 RepID=UPI00140BDC0E|nr:YcxB family protein [Neobacillus terrae]NHM30049.1 YcxB family protein [Neobacillus terrae]
MSPNALELSGTLTFNDFKRYNFHAKKKPETYYFFSVIIVLFFIFKMFNPELGIGYSLFVSIIIGIVVEIIRWFLLYLRVRKEFTSDQVIKNEVKYWINGNGINQERKASNIQIEWNDIISIYEYKDLFRLQISSNKAIVLPKSFFHSKGDINRFKKIIRQNINSKKLQMK